jgi:apolipoprotein N-acyltransferase
LLVVALLVAGRQQVAPAPHSAVSFMAVQPNIGLSAKSVAGGEMGIFEEHRRLAAEKLATSEQSAPQLLLWAETMFLLPATLPGSSGEIRRPRRGFPQQHAVNSAEEVLELQTTAARYAAEVVAEGGFFLTGAHLYRAIGADAPPEQTSPRGSETLVFSKDGELLHHVGKSELVPFGESLPFGGQFPGSGPLARFIFDNFGLSPDFLRAQAPTPLTLVFADGRELKLGTAICWENAYEHVFREQAIAGAEAFCVISNEAWYGLGAEMKQMVAATRFRAVESGRPVVRVTNTGHTVLVSVAGQIVAQIAPGQAQVMISSLPQIAGDYQTAYLKWGWLLGPELAIGAILMALFVAGRKSRDISS